MASQNSLVTNRILQYIRERGLQPGDPLPNEFALIEYVGVSRSTLREAIWQLRTLGIVHVKQGVGSVVGSGSLRFISDALVYRTQAPGRNLASGLMELIEIRTMLEVGLAHKVAGQLSEDQIARLYECTARMSEDKENSQADQEFHSILYENIDNAIAYQLVQAFWEAFDQSKLALPKVEAIKATRPLHEGLIEAYQSADVQWAEQAMQEHFRYIRQRLQAAQ